MPKAGYLSFRATAIDSELFGAADPDNGETSATYVISV